MIYNYAFNVDFNFVSNLIIFLFNDFPVFFVRFNVRIMCGRLVKFCEDEEFTTSSQLVHECQPAKGHKHMLEFEKSLCHARFHKSLCDSNEWPTKLTA